jgi:maltose-binding protein MalE
MNLRVRILSVILLIVVTGGCLYAGSVGMRSDGSSGEEVSSWLSRTDTIYFWYTDEAMTDYINLAAVEFGRRENVHVLPVLADSSGLLEQINAASVEGDSFPDVYLVSNELLEKAYLSGLAVEIADENGVCTSDNFGEGALNAVTYSGKYVGYPFSFETSALVYNADYLDLWASQMALAELTTIEAVVDEDGNVISEEQTIPEEEVDQDQLAALTEEYRAKAVPTTLDDLLNISDTFDAPEGVELIMNWDVSDILFNYWFVGDVISMGGATGDDRNNVSLNNEAAVACLTEYQNLQQFFSIESENISYASAIDDFIAGKSLFTVGTTDIVAKLEAAAADGTLTFRYGVTTMPDVNETYKSRSLAVTQVVAVNGYSAHKDIANRFAQYLVTDCAENLYERTGVPAANRNADLDLEAITAFSREYEDSVPLPKMMETENFWMQLEVLFAKVWNGSDVSEELSGLEETMEVLLGDAG